MSQITAYAALTEAADDDLLVVVDVSDTTMSPGGSTKRITVADLAGSGGAVVPGGAELVISSGNVAVDASAANVQDLTLTQNVTIENPTGGQDRQDIIFRLLQNGTGGWAVTWGSAYDFGDAGIPAINTAAGNGTIVGFKLWAGKWCCLGAAPGFFG